MLVRARHHNSPAPTQSRGNNMTATQRECRIRSVGRWFCRWRMRTSLSKLLSSSRTAQAGAQTTLHHLYVCVCARASIAQGGRSTRPEQSTRILNKINYPVTGDNHRGYIFFFCTRMYHSTLGHSASSVWFRCKDAWHK